MKPYSRPKLSDFYTLFQSKRLEKHVLHSGTHLYSPYMAAPPGILDYNQICIKIERALGFHLNLVVICGAPRNVLLVFYEVVAPTSLTS